MTKGNRFWEN